MKKSLIALTVLSALSVSAFAETSTDFDRNDYASFDEFYTAVKSDSTKLEQKKAIAETWADSHGLDLWFEEEGDDTVVKLIRPDGEQVEINIEAIHSDDGFEKDKMQLEILKQQVQNSSRHSGIDPIDVGTPHDGDLPPLLDTVEQKVDALNSLLKQNGNTAVVSIDPMSGDYTLYREGKPPVNLTDRDVMAEVAKEVFNNSSNSDKTALFNKLSAKHGLNASIDANGNLTFISMSGNERTVDLVEEWENDNGETIKEEVKKRVGYGVDPIDPGFGVPDMPTPIGGVIDNDTMFEIANHVLSNQGDGAQLTKDKNGNVQLVWQDQVSGEERALVMNDLDAEQLEVVRTEFAEYVKLNAPIVEPIDPGFGVDPIIEPIDPIKTPEDRLQDAGRELVQAGKSANEQLSAQIAAMQAQIDALQAGMQKAGQTAQVKLGNAEDILREVPGYKPDAGVKPIQPAEPAPQPAEPFNPRDHEYGSVGQGAAKEWKTAQIDAGKKEMKTYLDSEFKSFEDDLMAKYSSDMADFQNDVQEQMDSVMASSHAISNSRPFLTNGGTAVGVGTGFSGDASAVAIGVAHSFVDTGWSVSGSVNATTGSDSDVSFGAGVQYQF